MGPVTPQPGQPGPAAPAAASACGFWFLTRISSCCSSGSCANKLILMLFTYNLTPEGELPSWPAARAVAAVSRRVLLVPPEPGTVAPLRGVRLPARGWDGVPGGGGSRAVLPHLGPGRQGSPSWSRTHGRGTEKHHPRLSDSPARAFLELINFAAVIIYHKYSGPAKCTCVFWPAPAFILFGFSF